MTLFGFGEVHPDYPVRVLNEREVRAAAGILLVLGMIAFLTTFLTGDFTLTRLMVLAFGADFAIRLFIGPAWAPAMILGRWFVRHQEPELTGAPQKRFAWALGLGIAGIMAVWTMGLNLSGPVALLAAGGGIWLARRKRQAAPPAPPVPLSAEEEARLAEILKD